MEQNSGKHSWSEIRQAVNDLRREMSAISNMVPMNITFKRLSKHKFRIFFLRRPQNGWEITLLYTDVNISDQPSEERLEWWRLLGNGSRTPGMGGSSIIQTSSISSSRWSREEQLLRERQRAPTWGITAYELHKEAHALVFPAASELFLVDFILSTAKARVVRTCRWGAPLTPSLCPTGSGDTSSILVAHAARRDLWLASPCLTPTRLTYASNGADRLADDPLQAGVPCYVMQEEFSRYNGFWWQPKTNDNVYRIVYEEVDESDVKIYTFPSSLNSNGESEEFRFPRAGTPNAHSTLRLLEFTLVPSTMPRTDSEEEDEGYDGYRMDCMDDNEFYGNKHSEVPLEVQGLKWFDLKRSISESFPWCEYIPRVGWTPCGQFVWVQLLDRPQQRLELVLIHLEDFSEPFQYPSGPGSTPTRNDSVPHDNNIIYDIEDEDIWHYKQVLISETTPDAWVNVHDILHFLPAPEGQVRFIWASEETGFLHLYKVECKLSPPVTKQQRLAAMMEDGNHSAALYAATSGPTIVSKIALTYGDWEVIGRKIWVDEQRELVYFMALRETPLERHLYCVSYGKNPGTVKLITKPGYSYSVDIDEECVLATVTRSSVSQPPYCGVFRLKHENPSLGPQVPSLTLLPAGILMHPEFTFLNGQEESDITGSPVTSACGLLHGSVPTLHVRRVAGSSEPCFAMLWRPAGYEHGKQYPTVLHVYGGPEVQTVTNAYKGMRQLRMAMLAARGFCVVSVDSHGSKHRGLKWEAAIRGKMGQVELEDQVEMLQWLAAETGCIDLNRVGVHGWSYGGYLALLALATRPDVFKACVAGAPVTCWLLYDTAYTERYMGVPPMSQSCREGRPRVSQQHTATTDHATYRRASVLARAEDFPDEENRLLIIHGLVDENVHFAHTAALVSALVKAGKPHRVQLYPGERHSLRRHDAARHYETQLLAFLHEVL